MESKLQELTQKIYNEGVEKSKIDAEKILNEAKLKAENIIKDANDKAARLKLDSEKKATELIKTAENEVNIASEQMISSLQQNITNLIISKVLEGPITSVINANGLLSDIICKVATRFDEDINIVISESEKEEITKLFSEKILKELKQGANLSFDSNFQNGFKIGPKDGGYMIDFTKDDFIEYFKTFLRPRTFELLFGK